MLKMHEWNGRGHLLLYFQVFAYKIPMFNFSKLLYFYTLNQHVATILLRITQLALIVLTAVIADLDEYFAERKESHRNFSYLGNYW